MGSGCHRLGAARVRARLLAGEHGQPASLSGELLQKNLRFFCNNSPLNEEEPALGPKRRLGLRVLPRKLDHLTGTKIEMSH